MDNLTLRSDDRILVLAPHPDDETIATGGVIQDAVALGLPARVVFLTYGDNAETAFIAYKRRPILRAKSVRNMGLHRHSEAVAAAGKLGLQPDQLIFLGYPDFRTLAIWDQHWGGEPRRSMFTRTTHVPYANAYRPGTPYTADEILADIKTLIREFRPTRIFVSHPGDHNTDHLSLYLFTRVALWDLGLDPAPEVHLYLVHHPDWPQPKVFLPDQPLLPPGRLASDAAWLQYPLSEQNRERKLVAMQQHASQLVIDPEYLRSFVRANELFCDTTEVDLGSSRDSAGSVKQEPAPLSREEPAQFVGSVRRTVWLAGDTFNFAVELGRPITQGTIAAASIFPYRAGRPFAQMPKIHLRISEFGQAIYDQGKRLRRAPVEFSQHRTGFTVRLPLSFLGDPDILLGTARTYLRTVPVDWVAWATLRMPGKP